MQVYALLIWTVGYFSNSFFFSLFFFVFAILWTSYFRPAYTHLYRTSLVNKGYIIIFFYGQNQTFFCERKQVILSGQDRPLCTLKQPIDTQLAFNKRSLKITWVLPWSNGKRKINTNLASKTLEGENTCVH